MIKPITINMIVLNVIADEKTVPKIANNFFSPFFIKPPRPRPIATRLTKRSPMIQKPTIIALADFSFMPPGVVASIIPAMTKTRNMPSPAPRLMTKEAIPIPECFFASRPGAFNSWVVFCCSMSGLYAFSGLIRKHAVLVVAEAEANAHIAK
jgi:hypothetical protein